VEGGAPTYGYKLVEGLLVPNKLEVKWVNEIFKWYLDGDSVPKIKDRLLKNAVVTRRGNPIWSEGSIQNILTENTHYQGFWIYIDKKSEEKIRVECPAIVSPNTILKVKELYEKRKYSSGNHQRTARKYKYLLKDIIECGHCGGVYSGWKSATNKQSPYYSCITKKNNINQCSSKRNLNMTNTDKLVWEIVRNTIGNSSLFKESVKNEMLDDKSIVQTKTDVKKIEAKLKKNDHLIQRITESIVNQETDKLIGIRSKKEINSVLDRLDIELLKLKSNKERMTKEISNKHQNSQWVNWISEWGIKLEKMEDSEFNFNDKKELLKTVVDKIIVRSETNLEHELTIKFKLPYVDDELIYKDKDNKKKGYILKDGSYSKKLRIDILKKN